MEEFLKSSLLDKIYEDRNEEFTHFVISNSKDYKKEKNKLEKRLTSLLNYIPGEHYEYVKNEIDEILYDFVGFTEFWNKPFYMLGIVDGLKLEKELKDEVEKVLNGKSDGKFFKL